MKLPGAAISSVLILAAVIGANGVNGDSAGAGNGVYRVYVEDRSGRDGLGAFTVATGPDHPAGEGREVLFGEDGPGDAVTSYITLRSYTTGTDYVQTMSGPSSGNPVAPLEDFGTVEAIGSTGYRTTYDLPGAGTTPEALRLVSEITVSGQGPSDSSVEIATAITNDGDFPVELGVRYLLDVAPGGDDGPALFASGVAQTTERTYSPAPAVAEVSGSSVSVRVTSQGDRVPDSLKYAYWPDASAFAFDYATKGRDIASPEALDDAALLYYFGAERAKAIRIGPGESARVSLVIGAADAPGLEVCDNGIDDDGDLLVDAGDPDCGPSPGTPAPTGSPAPSTIPAGPATPAALPRTGGPPKP
jgi:hypothetical protein